MKYFLAVILCIFLFEIKTTQSRMCHQCEEDDCRAGPGLEVDCGDGHFAVMIVTVKDEVTLNSSFVVASRYCINKYEGGWKEFPCISGLGGHKDLNGYFEDCFCDTDFCNAKAPECSKRALDIDVVRVLLAEDCKEEVEKANLRYGSN